jgi:hypothetical protein
VASPANERANITLLRTQAPQRAACGRAVRGCGVSAGLCAACDRASRNLDGQGADRCPGNLHLHRHLSAHILARTVLPVHAMRVGQLAFTAERCRRTVRSPDTPPSACSTTLPCPPLHLSTRKGAITSPQARENHVSSADATVRPGSRLQPNGTRQLADLYLADQRPLVGGRLLVGWRYLPDGR